MKTNFRGSSITLNTSKNKNVTGSTLLVSVAKSCQSLLKTMQVVATVAAGETMEALVMATAVASEVATVVAASGVTVVAVVATVVVAVAAAMMDIVAAAVVTVVVVVAAMVVATKTAMEEMIAGVAIREDGDPEAAAAMMAAETLSRKVEEAVASVVEEDSAPEPLTEQVLTPLHRVTPTRTIPQALEAIVADIEEPEVAASAATTTRLVPMEMQR